MVQTISSPLCDPMPFKNPVLKVTLNITISKDGEYAFSKYSNEKGDFITVNPNSRIILRYLTKDRQWEPSQQVSITYRNMFQLRLGFKSFYKKFQREDLYYYNEYGRIEEVIADDDDRVIIPLNMGQLIKLEPGILHGERNETYPAVIMTLNKEWNRVELTIDEFESLLEIISTINLYQSGLTLLQTYIGMKKMSVESTIDEYNKKKEEKSKRYSDNRTKGVGSIFDKKEGSDESKSEVSGPPIKKTPSSLEDV